MNRKPMLAVDCGGDLAALSYPMFASPKLDGVRAIIADGVVLSRSLKPIPNKNVQALYDGLPDGLDGELIAGDPCAPDAYRKTVSMVMSEDAPVDGLAYWVFDLQHADTFIERLARLKTVFAALENAGSIRLVPQVVVGNVDAVERVEADWTGRGYEGVILRKPKSPYKHGRSTVREGYLLKLKRFQDGEAEVIGVTELMHNGNEAKINALGHTERSHKKAGLVGTGTMGTLQVRDVKTGVEFEIGTGFTAQDRKDIWQKYQYDPEWYHLDRAEVPLVKYKHFPSGAKDKPRHPVFLGWRDKRDV